MKTIFGQITEEFGELGKKIVKEVSKVPGDIVMPKKSDASPAPNKTQETKEPVAPRRILEQFARKSRPEPSIFEKQTRQEQETKETKKQQREAAAWQQLPKTGSAKKKGDIRNITQKATTEASKNMVNQ